MYNLFLLRQMASLNHVQFIPTATNGLPKQYTIYFYCDNGLPESDIIYLYCDKMASLNHLKNILTTHEQKATGRMQFDVFESFTVLLGAQL